MSRKGTHTHEPLVYTSYVDVLCASPESCEAIPKAMSAERQCREDALGKLEAGWERLI
jgi:hypothetical protein